MQIVIYNPIGASKGHSKIYTSGIINGFNDPKYKITLITSKDFDKSLLVRKDINFLRINQITSKKIRKINLLDNFKYGIFLLKNSLQSFKYLTTCNQKNTILLLIGGNTLFNCLYLLLIPNKEDFGLTLHNADYNLKLYRKDYLKFVYKLINKILLKILIKTKLKLFCHGEYTKIEIAKQINSKINRIDSYLTPIEIKHNKNNHETLSDQDNFSLLFFGIIREDKGLDILINALNLCEEIKYSLCICGNPEQIGLKRVQEILNFSNHPERISKEFDYVEDHIMEQYFKKATYIVLPYKKTFKALSVVFSDSVKRYKPVISSELSQNGFDTKKYKIGEVFESENIYDLSLAIKRAYFKWENKNLPKKENFSKYLDESSPANVTKTILKSFKKE